jgi:two-component system phosphate regulon response regulator PhoB
MPSDDVLLVDADPSALGIMAHGLARQGFQVRSVAKSEQAFAELSKTVPSLVISDVEPSGADGLRILEVMRRDPRTAKTPVLLLAKGEWTRRRSEAQQLGAQDLLQKPLFVQDLAVLGRLYAGHSAAEEVFTGNLEDLRCTMLLRSLLAGGRSGQLSFDPAGGRIYFHDGRVVDAVLPPLNGERALWRLLTFDQGRYRLRFGPVERTHSMSIDVRELQNRGGEHVRRWEELCAAVGSTATVLEVDFRRLSSQLDAVPPAVLPLLRLFDGQRTVGQVIDAFGMDDLVGTQVLIKLSGLGLLRPVGVSQPARIVVAPAVAVQEVAQEVAAESAPTLIVALSDVIAPPLRETAPESTLAAEALEYDPAPPTMTMEEAFPEAADLGAALAAIAAEPPEASDGSVGALALDADTIEQFLFGDIPQAETLAAAAAVSDDNVREPSDVSLLPIGVALAIGAGETPAPADAGRIAEAQSVEGAAVAPSLAGDFESDFFSTQGVEAVLPALATPAVAISQPEVAIPAPQPVPRWVWGAIGLAAVAAVSIVFLPRPTHQPKLNAQVATLPPPATELVAPGVPEKLAPVADAVDRVPEMAKLIEQGQEAYDAREFAQAEEAFQSAANLRPEDPVAQMFLGLSQYEQGKLAEAQIPLEKAKSLDPQNDRTNLLLGAVYQELGKRDLARESYETYLKLQPRGEYARDVRAILARMARTASR